MPVPDSLNLFIQLAATSSATFVAVVLNIYCACSRVIPKCLRSAIVNSSGVIVAMSIRPAPEAFNSSNTFWGILPIMLEEGRA